MAERERLFSFSRKQPYILNKIYGAEEKTRTSTRIPPLDPEPSASTNSATSATHKNMLVDVEFVKSFLVQIFKIVFFLL